MDIRIDFVQSFNSKYLNLQKCLPGSSHKYNQDHKDKPRVKSRLTDSNEAWTCPICASKHINPGMVRICPTSECATSFKLQTPCLGLKCARTIIIVKFALQNMTLNILMQSAPWSTGIDVPSVQPPHEKLIHCLPVFNMNRKVSHPLL